jgi:hypothetical protein
VPVVPAHNERISPYIMGDSGFPLRYFMLTPYNYDAKLTSKQRKFNYLFSGLRCTVERVLGHVNGRFRAILNESDDGPVTRSI